MKIGDVIIAVDCVGNAEGTNEHPAIVTRVWSPTEINCTIFPDGVSDQVCECSLHHESVNATGKRFRLP